MSYSQQEIVVWQGVITLYGVISHLASTEDIKPATPKDVEIYKKRRDGK